MGSWWRFIEIGLPGLVAAIADVDAKPGRSPLHAHRRGCSGLGLDRSFALRLSDAQYDNNV
jgi:hypothetical protein